MTILFVDRTIHQRVPLEAIDYIQNTCKDEMEMYEITLEKKSDLWQSQINGIIQKYRDGANLLFLDSCDILLTKLMQAGIRWNKMLLINKNDDYWRDVTII